MAARCCNLAAAPFLVKAKCDLGLQLSELAEAGAYCRTSGNEGQFTGSRKVR